jgi:predicted RNA-binding Zn ribbon-like protein
VKLVKCSFTGYASIVNAALELVNSDWWRGRPDRRVDKLADDEWLAAYAERVGFGPLAPATRPERRRLAELRDRLRTLVEAPSPDGLSSLDPYAARATLRRRVVDGRLVLEGVERDWTWAMSEIAASFVELVADGDPSRIKVCANHDCQWSFYDESKNRSRRWCGAASCGTADKVRRFRARRRAALS